MRAMGAAAEKKIEGRGITLSFFAPAELDQEDEYSSFRIICPCQRTEHKVSLEKLSRIAVPWTLSVLLPSQSQAGG